MLGIVMAKPSNFVIPVAGLLSPLASAYLGLNVYGALTRASSDRDQDFVYRLSMVLLAMIAPFVVTLGLALWKRRHGPWGAADKAGLGLAMISLALAAWPASSLVNRWQQSRNLALQNVAAPAFDTLDLAGNRQRSDDHSGKVMLVNAWATWCYPCRAEMPKLDQLYQSRKDQGFIVLGVSTEDAGLQRRFVAEHVPVSYPLLTLDGDVPGVYRDIVRYPAIFLIDRQGRFQPAPGPDQPFEKVEAAVDALLN
jgi:thiol-disulfide isomerase/thioredoxin